MSIRGRMVLEFGVIYSQIAGGNAITRDSVVKFAAIHREAIVYFDLLESPRVTRFVEQLG